MDGKKGYTLELYGEKLSLETAEGLFSPEHADRGTLAMLSKVTLIPGQKVLDLGCGCGIVGILAAKCCGPENVVMVDIDPCAVEIATRNAVRNGVEEVKVRLSDGLEAVEETDFDLILCNPPYQTDFAVAKRLIEKGFNRLQIGGRMVMVTKRLDWYRNKLRAVFGGVRVQRSDGYYVFEAEKRSLRYANR